MSDEVSPRGGTFVAMKDLAASWDLVIAWCESVGAIEIKAWRGPDRQWRAVARIPGDA